MNFGEIPDDDIRYVDEKDIPDHDILCASFPCQHFSVNGKQLGFCDKRGILFFDVARIIREKRPMVVLLENVKNFATHDGGKTLDIVKNTIIDLGYSFQYSILNLVDYGIPQKRERIYMVCFRNDIARKKFTFPKPFKLNRFVEDFLLDDDMVKDLIINREDLVLNEKANLNFNLVSTIRVGTVGKGVQGERIYSPKGIAITLSAYSQRMCKNNGIS